MSNNQTKSRANMISCIAVAAAGLSISAVVILSLIPVYLEDKSVTKSRGRRSVDSINDMPYTANEPLVIFKRSLRSRLTLSTRTSIEQQLNVMLKDANVKCVLIRATMRSTTDDLRLRLKVHSIPKDNLWHSSPVKLVRQVLARLGNVTVHHRLARPGYIVLSLRTKLSSFRTVSRLSQSSSLSDSLRTSRSAKCVHKVADELNYRIGGDQSQGYQYYCFRWTTTKPQKMLLMSFVFDVNNGNNVHIDDVTLNSSSSLIDNGDFETKTSTAWSCGNQTCIYNYIAGHAKSGVLSFWARDAMSLSQLISRPAGDSGNRFRLGFWLKFNCRTTDPCAVTARIATSMST